MNAGLVEWGGIAKGVGAKSVGAKGIAYTGTLTGTLGRGALLLSAVVHGGLAAAFVGWGEPQPTQPQPIPIAIAIVAIAATPEEDAVEPVHAAESIQTEPQGEAALPEPIQTGPQVEAAAPEPVAEPEIASSPPPSEPVSMSDAALPEAAAPEVALELLPAPGAKPDPPAPPIAVATNAQPAAASATETAATGPASTEPAPTEPAATQTATLPDPASALGTAPDARSTAAPEAPADVSEDTPESGGAGFEPAQFDVAALGNPEPDYPFASRRAGEQGRVVLRVEVSAAGIVEAIEVADSSGHRRLDAAALDAVRHWRFEPARVGDRAIATTVSVPVTFRLE